MIDASLLQEFVTEADEHLEEMEAFLLQLESDPSRKEYLNDIFRCIHTIKGASEFVGLERISGFSHKLENLLDDLREGRTGLNEQIISFLIKARDRIARLVNELEAHGEEQTEVDDLLSQLSAWETTDEEESETGLPAEQSGPPQLDTLLLDEVDEPAPDLLLNGSPSEDPVDINTVVNLPDVPDIESEAKNESRRPSDLTIANPDELPLDDDETYDEENDSELFGIFMDQLRKKLDDIDTAIRTIDDGNPQEMFNLCRQHLASLRSSANYMGYEDLITYLDHWTAGVESARSTLDSGEQASTEFMDRYSCKLKARFLEVPQDSGVDSNDHPRIVPGDHALAESESGAKETVAADGIQGSDENNETRSLKAKLARAFDLFQSGPDENQTGAPTDDLNRVLTESSLVDEPEAVSEQAAPDEDELPEQEDISSISQPLSESEDADEVAADSMSGSDATELQNRIEETDLPDEMAADNPEIESLALPEQPQAETTSTKIGKKNMRVDTEKIDALMNQVGELVVGRSWFSQLVSEMREMHQQLKETSLLDKREMKLVKGLATKIGEATSALGRVVNDLQDGVMKIRMLPISKLFNRYPRLVRDLVLNTGKNVRLEIKGEETELDKMIIEQMSDPLIHIIRNAVDHGIENAGDRKKAGKPQVGRLELNAYHESNHVVIEIIDDGRGIDPEKIRRSARQKKFMSEPELDHMSDKELVGLIMKPGFSTAESVTHTSGRGVGMDVVKKNIEKLNGTIEIDSKIGLETRLRIKIPLTLAIISALLVKVGIKSFAIPLSAVEETLRINNDQIATVEGFEVIHLRSRTLPLLKLSEMFDIPSEIDRDEKAYVVMVSAGQRRIGLLVDSLIGQEEVVIKPLADYLQEDSTFSGATILGDGKISLIIDVEGLVNMAVRRHTLSRSGPLAFDIKQIKTEQPAESPVHGISN